MRILFLAIPAALLLTSNAGAQSTDYPAPDSMVSTVQVKAPSSAYRSWSEDTDFASGHYNMSNGWSLNVEATSIGIDATIDRQRTMHLIAIGPNRFVTRSGNVAMDFDLGGDPDAMSMSYVPRSNLAAVMVIRSTIASR